MINPDTIQNREDLVKFLKELSQNYAENPKSWENNDLRSFLSGLAGWVEDMDGYYLNHRQTVPDAPSWKTFAEMLTAAKSYE